MVPLERIEFSQEDISNTFEDTETGRSQSVGRMAARMRLTGWDRSRPAAVVRMPDGRLVSLDHRRLWAASRAEVREVSARVHEADEPIPPDQAARFEIRRGRVPSGVNTRTGQPWRRGDRPVTWGDAVRFRSAGQQFSSSARLTTSGPSRGRVPNATRDPSFPAEGSPRLPVRLPPRPMRPTPNRLYPTVVARPSGTPQRPGPPVAEPQVPRPIPPAPTRPGLAPTRVAPPPGPAPRVPQPIEPVPPGSSPGAMGRVLGIGGRLLSVVGVISTVLQAIDFARHADDRNSVLTTTGSFVDLQSLPVGTQIENWSTYPPRHGVINQDDHGRKYILWDDLTT